VDEPGRDHARSDRAPRVPALAEITELVDVVGQIAHRGDARGDVQDPVHLAEVRVHVPEAGQQRLSGGVDHLRTVGDAHLPVSSRAPHAVPHHHDGCARAHPPGLNVQHGGVHEG
jgi:hypothetical protein